MPPAYAHSANEPGQRHDLVEHLRAVAELVAEFSRAFNAEQQGYYLGLWHDLGKFHPAFQRYLLESEADPSARGHGPDHKAAGTLLARQYLGIGSLLIHGHHGGLRSPTDLNRFLADPNLQDAARQALDLAKQSIPDLLPASEQELEIPARFQTNQLAAEMFLRMLYSALIDADSLDTERHFSPEQAERRGSQVGIQTLWQRLAEDQKRFASLPSSAVVLARREIYQKCILAASGDTGLYRLTVPTGGGKTLSGMAFALQHALIHGLNRIIVAVPYISITEQTAQVYRGVFQDQDQHAPIVLEHHSGNRSLASDVEDFHSHQVWRRLAAENWDAPIIVTTTVQLFESLFANNRTPTRKLHRLARSVIILDEAQGLPSHLLTPILDALQQLCAHYGSTVVLSTATQPAFETIPQFASLPASEIIPDSDHYFNILRRVAYEWRTDEVLDWAQVAALLHDEPQALVVVNTRRDAIECLRSLDDPQALHLSTLLCGAHRRRILEEVRRRLSDRQPCRLVSTQVVEAGVDLDFPLVLRALGPLDSIIQAAGRCNREGRLDRGRVIIFRPEGERTPPGPYSIATGITRSLLGYGDLDPDDPQWSRLYYQRLYPVVSTDRDRIQESRSQFDYPETARNFRMIDDATESVAITQYGSPEERSLVQRLIQQLRQGTPEARHVLRRLQPYLVSVRAREAAHYHRQGMIAPIMDQVGEWMGAYDQTSGLITEPERLDTLVV